MATLERPRLVGLDVVPFQADGMDLLKIASRDRLTDHWLPLRREAGVLLQYMNGQHEIGQIREAVRRDYGIAVETSTVAQLVQLLDEVLVLDTPRYRQKKEEVETAFLQSPVREPAHAGTAYPSEPDKLHKTIRGLFEHVKGPGLPGANEPRESFRAIFAPHIDFGRGGPTYAWGFKQLAEKSDATVFVLVGTSHYSAHRYILTRKDFRTPLGTAKTNVDFVDRLAASYGPHAFADELAHKPEHSLEFHVLMLQYLFNHRRPFTIVPLLVGSFHDAVESGEPPESRLDVAKMIDALRQAERHCNERVCYVISGDLAHIGMKFGDPWPVEAGRSQWCRSADQALLAGMTERGAPGLFESIHADQDKRRICGFPPAYTALKAIGPARGDILRYDQYVDPRGFEIVSFASLAYHA